MLRYFQRKNTTTPAQASAPRTLTAGKIRCSYCLNYFSSQGIASHVRTHLAMGHQKIKHPDAAAAGKVKLRTQDKDGNWTTLSKAESEALQRSERNELEGGADDDCIVVIDSDDDDMASATKPAGAGGAGKTPEDERGVEEDADEPAGAGKTPEDERGVEEDAAEATDKTQDDEEDGGFEEVGNNAPAVNSRQRPWHVKEKAEILDLWYETSTELGKRRFCRYIGNKYKRKLQPSQLRKWEKGKETIHESANKKNADRRTQTQREQVGKYPDMEYRLSAWIRGMRQMGFVVETWMVNAEARTLLHELYPREFRQPPTDDGSGFPFKCSNGWRKGFFKRFGFSIKTIGKKVNMQASSEDMMSAIADFHIKTRVLQLSSIHDPHFGFTSEYNVYSHDQVPIGLADSNGKTVHDTGDYHVYDAVGKDTDIKRFCTLNLFGAMQYREDGLNIPKPHLVFQGKFQPGKDWHDQEEVSQWDSRVVISFQENAWVDGRTHRYGLKEVLGPINDILVKESMQGVAFEDNLSSHVMQATLDFWENDPSVSNFIAPQFLPARMTDIVQVIDRHIGIIYKRAVYRAMRAEYIRRLREAIKNAGRKRKRDEEVTVKALTPREKRIIITKAIADCHAKLTKATCDTYYRAFIATATWMPVSHMYDDPVLKATAVPVEESQVKLQHLETYTYQERCSLQKIAAAVKADRETRECARLCEEEQEQIIGVAIAAEKVSTQRFVAKANEVLPLLVTKVNEFVSEPVLKIHQETGYEHFLIGGSWAAVMIAEAVESVCSDDDSFDSCHHKLEANDIDVYHGSFIDEAEGKLIVDLHCIDYQHIDSVNWEVNTIKCSNLSTDSLLANNDINVTACCFNVDFSREGNILVSIHALPCFWQFIFERSENRKLRVVKPYDTAEYQATTLVRIAFKAFQLDFPFTCDIDPTDGTIAESQKVKIDQMKHWSDSPFHSYNCKKFQTYYKIVKKNSKETCVKCKSAVGNKMCSSKMCKKCCLQHDLPCSQHKRKK